MYQANKVAILIRGLKLGFLLFSLLLPLKYTHFASVYLLIITNMSSFTKEKHRANRSARRQSKEIVLHQNKRSKKHKDTDTESVASSATSSTIFAECPFRFVLTGLFETGSKDDGKKEEGCPLRRVQLWHTIPLCLLAVINLLLVIAALLGLAGYRITMGIQKLLVNLAKPDLDYDPFLDNPQDEVAVVVVEKRK